MAEVTPEEVLGGSPLAASRTGRAVTLMGGVVSLALTAGIVVWGYKMISRDVSGVPIVQAQLGPMRVAPDNPGGELALHTGLSVNAVAAVGGAASPEDRLVLAPGGVDLTAEDVQTAPTTTPQTVDRLAGAVDVTPQAPQEIQANFQAPNNDAPLTADEILELADQIAAQTSAPLATPQNTDASAVVLNAVAANANTQTAIIPASVPGVSVSLRPQLRPDRGLAPLADTTPTPVAARTIPVSTDALPTGTKLAQLGAFDTPELANSEWQRLATRFNALIAGHDPVIQQASSGGRTFYRLRVSGFTDLSDARRFCSALMAEDAACIPVVVR
ncbi:SPOR domain-containing protein [Aestuariibius sp. HNIBRBA575]|uniref:SPOR domain-containing protein n=1 Tax=Aestuariibius sp. HNIBRBA575 TaxID=3233343 RepID=UPI0034A13F53